AEIAPWEPAVFNNMGVAFYHMEEYDSAIVAFNTAIRRQPTYAHAFGNLAQTYIAIQNYRRALAAANQAIKLDADYGDAYLLKALALEKNGQRDEAFLFYEAAVKRLPGNAGLRINLGSYYYDKGLVDDALFQYSKALELEPGNAKVHFNLGNCYTRKCLLEEASIEYETAINLDTTMISALNNYGLILMNQDRQQAALQVFLRAYHLSQEKPVIAFNISIVLEGIGKLEQALEYCQRAISTDSSIAVFYLQKGNILHQMDKNQSALAAYKKAIVLEPNMAMSYNNMGNLLIETQNVQQAQDAYRKAAELFPQNIENLYFSGAERFADGMNNLFGDCVDDVKIKRQFSFIYNNLGTAYRMLGEDQNALAAFEQAGRTCPDLVEPFENLGFIYQEIGKNTVAKHFFAKAFLNRSKIMLASDSLQAAKMLVLKAVEYKPDFAEAYAQLGLVDARHGDTKNSQKAFQTALEYGRNNSDVLYTYGDYLERKGNLNEAAGYYERVVQIDATYLEARKKLAHVLLQLGKISEAQKQTAATHFLKGRQLEYAGQWDMAFEEYESAHHLDSLNADYICAQGLVNAKKHLNERAKYYFDKALAINPRHAAALYGLGIVYGDKKHHQEAIDVLSKSISLQPENADAHYALAVNYYFLGNLDKSREHVKKAQNLGKIVRQDLLSELNLNNINKN
ncbi:tetratricopeptide repeat protein, partial [candidate division KSB1 bacterium]|nr:tetratricopeptide repeat protein [candidate division KSB1 bacterium]